MPGWLLDTNVVLRIQEERCDQYELVTRAVAELVSGGFPVCVAPQIIAEFWAAATRPKDVNGLGWETSLAEARAEVLLNKFEFLEDTPSVFPIWLDLVRTHAVKGKQVHDARLVAVVKAHAVENLLTFNVDDFKTYQEINAVHPASVVQGS